VIHPDVLLSQLSASQLVEWEAFAILEPFGAQHDNLKFGMICATMMNALAQIYWDKKKGPRPQWKPSDFFPDPKDHFARKDKQAELKEKLMRIAEVFND